MTKDRIEKLIAKGELKTALDELLAWTKGKVELVEVYNLLLSNAGRLADLERNKQGGELDHEKAAQLESQIRNAVVGILGQVPASAWNAKETNAESKLGELRADPLLLNFVKKYGDAYDYDHALFTDFWEEVQQKYGVVRERDLLAIMEDVHQALQEIFQLAIKFVANYLGKGGALQWLDFKNGILEKYGVVMSGRELAAFVEEKKRNFEEMLKDFVWIQGGEFMMGATEYEKYAHEWEKPRHHIRLFGFYMGKYTITVRQFGEFIRATGYRTDADKQGYSKMMDTLVLKYGANWSSDAQGIPQDNHQHPVIHVSWNDAIAFCNYWNQKYGFAKTYDAQGNLLNENGHQTSQLHQVCGFRLPTEAEWEYACRAGSTFYHVHESFNDLGPQPVGSYSANPWGLYDMLGNVQEWCQDHFSYQFYDQCQEKGTVENPLSIESGDYRVIRSGDWSHHESIPWRREYQPSDYHNNCISFRVVLFVKKS